MPTNRETVASSGCPSARTIWALDKPHRSSSEGHSCFPTHSHPSIRRWIEAEAAFAPERPTPGHSRDCDRLEMHLQTAGSPTCCRRLLRVGAGIRCSRRRFTLGLLAQDVTWYRHQISLGAELRSPFTCLL